MKISQPIKTLSHFADKSLRLVELLSVMFSLGWNLFVFLMFDDNFSDVSIACYRGRLTSPRFGVVPKLALDTVPKLAKKNFFLGVNAP
jgi:hypothetical protein